MDKLVSGAQEFGLRLTPEQIQQFAAYYQELISWNHRFNLTAITNYEEVQTKHFLDSLTLAPALGWTGEETKAGSLEGLKMLDVGSGAGLPGVPLKILHPSLSLTLLDSVVKKTSFLRHLVAWLGLDKVEVVAARAEELGHDPSYRERFDVVVSRAVANLTVLLELTLPFLRRGGLLVAPKTEPIEGSLEKAAHALTLLGGSLKKVAKVDVPLLPGQRVLVVVEKVAPTPSRYPRRSGIPFKRPL